MSEADAAAPNPIQPKNELSTDALAVSCIMRRAYGKNAYVLLRAPGLELMFTPTDARLMEAASKSDRPIVAWRVSGVDVDVPSDDVKPLRVDCVREELITISHINRIVSEANTAVVTYTLMLSMSSVFIDGEIMLKIGEALRSGSRHVRFGLTCHCHTDELEKVEFFDGATVAAKGAA